MILRRSNRGFTLVEVAVAIAILGVAMVALVGLHTDTMGTYIRERNRSQAALIAKRIMSRFEIDPTPPEIGTEESSVTDALKDLSTPENKKEKDSLAQFEGWEFTQRVTSVDLPFAEDAMRRIDIVIVWGPRVNDSFTLSYFVRTLPES